MKWCKPADPFHKLERVRGNISKHACALQVALHAPLERNGHTGCYFWSVFQGDLGGQSICAGQNSGIVSFGEQCENTSVPGVYTWLTEEYVDWIKRTISRETDPWNSQEHFNKYCIRALELDAAALTHHLWNLPPSFTALPTPPQVYENSSNHPY